MNILLWIISAMTFGIFLLVASAMAYHDRKEKKEKARKAKILAKKVLPGGLKIYGSVNTGDTVLLGYNVKINLAEYKCKSEVPGWPVFEGAQVTSTDNLKNIEVQHITVNNKEEVIVWNKNAPTMGGARYPKLKDINEYGEELYTIYHRVENYSGTLHLLRYRDIDGSIKVEKIPKYYINAGAAREWINIGRPSIGEESPWMTIVKDPEPEPDLSY